MKKKNPLRVHVLWPFNLTSNKSVSLTFRLKFINVKQCLDYCWDKIDGCEYIWGKWRKYIKFCRDTAITNKDFNWSDIQNIILLLKLKKQDKSNVFTTNSCCTCLAYVRLLLIQIFGTSVWKDKQKLQYTSSKQLSNTLVESPTIPNYTKCRRLRKFNILSSLTSYFFITRQNILKTVMLTPNETLSSEAILKYSLKNS